MPKIQRLEVRGFRGVHTQTSLLFDGRSVLLFGENGTGKSSFVDAIEKLFTGKVSTLDGRAQGISSDRHGPHIHNGANTLAIAVTFDDPAASTFKLSFKTDDLPSEIRQYVTSARENLYILRRLQVLEFIESQPRERYAKLRPFLPLTEVEAIENALRQAKEKADAEAQRARQDSERVINQIRREVGLPTSFLTPSEKEVVAALSGALVKVGQRPIGQIQDLEVARSSLDQALAPFGDLSRQSQISNVARALGQLSELFVSPSLTGLVNSLQEFQDREAREARIFYETVLEQGIRWIQEERRDTCPLCQNQIKPDELVTQVQARLEEMREIVQLRRRTQATLEQTRQTIRSGQELLVRLDREVNLMTSEDRDRCQVIVWELQDAVKVIWESLTGDLRELEVEQIRIALSLVGTGSALQKRTDAERTSLEQILNALPSPENAQHILSTRNLILRVKELWADLERGESRCAELAKQAAIALRLHENAQAARREEVQGIYDELSDDISIIYTRLHPDESHGGVRLEVRDVGQGSANLKANFYERQDEDPRGYYSDAHLDTLGISIFLALRRWHRKQRPTFDLLVLDDVLTSVDTAHAVRLSELLLQEFRDYQILLTTHDRIWFEHMRDIQARCRVSNNFINKVIHKWTIEEGPDLREPEDERREIVHLISEGSGKEIAVMAGRLLEHILQEMRYSLRLSVQAKRGEQYEIGDLWPVFYATVKKVYPSLYNVARAALDALDVRWPVRNWIGAHHNQWAQNVSRSTAIDFARAVGDLYDLVFCGVCRRFISPSATPLGQLSCRCGEKIYPAPGKETVRPKTREELIKETDGVLRDARFDSELYLAWKREESGREH
jgi:ABC-type dipeptide/oligopeptide/nickel transport system ATPase subunit